MKKHIITTQIIVFLIFTNIYSQSKIITGVVTNKYDEVIANVKVSCKDSLNTVFTNKKGEYNLN